MRSTSFAILAAATAAAAQTTEISFFYPEDNPDYEDFAGIALSIVEVQDADHTVVEFACASSTTSSASPTSTDDDYHDYEDSCVFAGGALTATVGPDSFAYTTSASDYGDGWDFTVTMGCTSAKEVAYCTFQSAGKDAWSDYCSNTLDYYNDDNALSSCVTAHASSVLPASTSALQADEVGAITMTVTAGANKLSAGAAASATGASSTTPRSKFTVSQTAVAGGATTTIGGPSSSASGTAASGSASGSASSTTPAVATGGAVRRGAAVAGVVGGVVAALAL